MSIRPPKSEFEATIESEFPMRLLSVPGNAALIERRKQAFARFQAVGLPTRHDEQWHYTDLRTKMPSSRLSALEPMAQETARAESPIGKLVDQHIRLSRGGFVSTAPLPEGIEFFTLKTALVSRPDLLNRLGEGVSDNASALVALNTALFPDMSVILVKKGVRVDLPIHGNFLYMAGMPLRVDARILMVVEDGASVTMINSVGGDDTAAYQVNAVVELLIGDDASVNYVRSSIGGRSSLSLHTIGARLGARSELNLFCFNTASSLARTEVHLAFTGEGAKAGLRGVSMLRGEQHGDMTLVVDHQAPGCESRELFRSIVDERATGVFQGKISVRQAAQKTDGQMASNAILLSEDAVMNNKPELEIFADDVVCAHGATCGELDDDLLFYLQARGLPKNEAEALMLQAFCGEAIEFVENENVRAALNEMVEAWLKARGDA